MAQDYDPTDRTAAFSYIQDKLKQGEYLTGLLYIDETKPDFHDLSETTKRPLNKLSYDEVNPGAEKLGSILARYR